MPISNLVLSQRPSGDRSNTSPSTSAARMAGPLYRSGLSNFSGFTDVFGSWFDPTKAMLSQRDEVVLQLASAHITDMSCNYRTSAFAMFLLVSQCLWANSPYFSRKPSKWPNNRSTHPSPPSSCYHSSPLRMFWTKSHLKANKPNTLFLVSYLMVF